MNFTATTRKAQGTGASRRLRRENKLPGIVYGNDQAATPIVLDHNPIFYALRKEAFHSSVLTLNLDGVDQLVVLRSFQLHPYKQQVLHIDFQRVDPNKPPGQRARLRRCGDSSRQQRTARLSRSARALSATWCPSSKFTACRRICLSSSMLTCPT